MTKYIAALLLFSIITVRAQDDDEREYVASCSLSLKTMVLPPAKESRAGQVKVEAFLCESSGSPIPNQAISMTATHGTFSCMAPDADSAASGSSDRSCFITGPDGRISVYLTDVPFNSPGRIKAACTYGEFSLAASGTYSISRGVKKVKSRTRPRRAAPPPSTVLP